MWLYIVLAKVLQNILYAKKDNWKIEKCTCNERFLVIDQYNLIETAGNYSLGEF